MTDKIKKSDKKLSIIFAADIFGYSALMRDNELRTLNLLKKTRAITDPLISKYNGRIANTAGDSIIAVFEGAENAIACSIEIQTRLAKANSKISPDKKMLFRIGLNVGEIYSNGNDILGDGVNIAARIEAQAEQGAIAMSENYYKLVSDQIAKMPTAVIQNVKLKNIKTPATIYEIMSNRAVIANQKQKFGKKYRLKIALIVILGSLFASFAAALMVTKNLQLIGF